MPKKKAAKRIAKKKVKPGDTFDVQSFELSVQQAVPLAVSVKEMETTDRLVMSKDGKKKVASRPAMSCASGTSTIRKSSLNSAGAMWPS